VRPLRSVKETYTTGSGEERPGIILEDGRVHPSYNRLPATGRYSSSSPNAQNIPYFLRDLFIPAPGYAFVGADMDQLELRLVAEESGAARLLHSFNSGNDPHNETMEIVYGDGIWTLDGAPEDHNKKGKGVFKDIRGLTKNVRYAWQYGAGATRIHEQVIAGEDEGGKLIYADKTVQDIRSIIKGLARADPEIPAWWRRVLSEFRRHGFIADPLWGRRRDFLDEEKLTEIANHPIQAGGAAIVHEAMIEILYGSQPWFSTKGENPYPYPLSLIRNPYGLPTRLITQTHDSLVFEVPEDQAEEFAGFLTRAMTRRRKEGAKLTYTAEADVGLSWVEV
jgi:DNA polymerase-1